jgi:hypothetical protein
MMVSPNEAGIFVSTVLDVVFVAVVALYVFAIPRIIRAMQYVRFRKSYEK